MPVPASGAGELPFFVYGTLRPGQDNHDRFLRGRTAGEEPARLPGAVLHEGPGYPFLAGGAGEVRGELVWAAPGEYGALLSVLDRLERFTAPGHPLNLYERRAREVRRARDGSAVRAWVYLAAPAVRLGAAIAGGDWLNRPGAPEPPLP
ncbi:gamma-glutamylcyclotransferase [Streptomyces sp. LP05-1]|uniref:Gamma-glutamylcyclotransferase n=1 Tax=Streptomyces pyxinae TaxID=2970734 RepID=A0ABT2CNC6_9ACTN|nr:gamma-glutamylcyclotransferase family protein [Streptomyces sp. LP05-1]MCS0638206.1 gamma-glutamylcyclotransferase [Streptomyces sp. LP05-1]